jgi:hypothetical protein
MFETRFCQAISPQPESYKNHKKQILSVLCSFFNQYFFKKNTRIPHTPKTQYLVFWVPPANTGLIHKLSTAMTAVTLENSAPVPPLISMVSSPAARTNAQHQAMNIMKFEPAERCAGTDQSQAGKTHSTPYQHSIGLESFDYGKPARQRAEPSARCRCPLLKPL